VRKSLVLSLLVLSLPSIAMAAAPSLGYIYPPVVRAGQQTSVQLGGYDLTPDSVFLVADERVRLQLAGELGSFIVLQPPYWFGNRGREAASPIPREIAAQIDVPADMPAGLVRWQVANANGSSSQALILVSHGTEILEDRFRDSPQLLNQALPLAVSGRIERISETDRYQLVAAKDGPVTLQMFARRLGSNFNAAIKVHTADGTSLVNAADTEGRDLAVTFSAVAGEEYTISLHDVDFRGNRAYVYRLVITAGPQVVTSLPARLQTGVSTQVQLLGYGVATGAPQLESVVRAIEVPADAPGGLLRYQLETPFGTTPTIEIPLSQVIEQVHLDGPPPQLEGEFAITGRMMADIDEVCYRWTAKAGESWRLELSSRAIAGTLDMAIYVRDSEGKDLLNNDDLPGTTDAGLEFTVPADGDYQLCVREVSGLARDLVSVYRLSAARRMAGFRVTGPQSVLVPVAGKVDVPLKLIRYGDFKGEVTVSVAGLPAGVKLGEVTAFAEGKVDLKVSLEATAEIVVAPSWLQWSSTATIGEGELNQPVYVPRSGNLAAHDPAREFGLNMLLVPTMTAPFSVELVDKNRQRAVHRGTTYPAPFIIKRDEGFDGQIQLQMASTQGRRRQGIHGPILAVPADAGEILYPTFLPEWLETDRTTRMVVVGVGQVKDAAGNVHFLFKNADARVTMILEGALLKLSQSAQELTVDPGSSFRIPVNVARSRKLPVAATITLDIPAELQGLVAAEPVVLRAEQVEAEILVTTQADPRLLGNWQLQLRARALQDDRWPVISLTSVPVRFESAVPAGP
jgi:hypothetical protein